MSKTILVVDDEPLLCSMLSEILEEAGYKVLVANSGNTGLQCFKQNHVDLIITDVRMPDGTGIELLAGVKAVDIHKPVIFVSGFSDISIDVAYDQGVEALFAKPINYSALLNNVSLALEPRTERWQKRAVRVQAKCNVEIASPSFDQAVRTKILDIGRGGMFASMNGELPKVATFVSFKIKITGESEISGTGVVRWVREFATGDKARGIGIEFMEFSEQSRQQLITLINSIRTQAFIPVG